MIKLSACIETVFHEHPFVERVAAAKNAGFVAYEFWGWSGKDLPALLDAQKAAGIPCATCCVASRDEARNRAFNKGCLLKKENAGVFAEMVEETYEFMKPFGIDTFICTTGQELSYLTRAEQQAALVSCLREGARVAQRLGITLVLEPLNVLVNHKGYYLAESKQAFEVLDLVDNPSMKLLFDIYHQQITEGNLIQNITNNIGKIGHFHLADVPGRHEPGTGEINYGNVFAAIAKTPYAAYVGCEYSPSEGQTTVSSAREVLRLAALS